MTKSSRVHESSPSSPSYFVPGERDVRIYHLNNTPPFSHPPPSFFSPGVTVQSPLAGSSNPTFTPRYRFVSYELELRRSPGPATCSSCQVQVTSQVTYRVGRHAWLMCLVFVLCGLVLGCCLIPLFVRRFKDAYHTCPHCHKVLHVHRRTCCR